MRGWQGAAAPGTVLQWLYLRERLRRLRPGRFVEIGCGDGRLAALLLAHGWRGTAYELNAEAAAVARHRNAAAIERAEFTVEVADWLALPPSSGQDLVLSAMVLEHLDADDEHRYLVRAGAALGPSGTGVLLVPASMRHWGIEDEIAGHFRRYERASLAAAIMRAGLELRHLAGLTWPVSNILLPLSNRLVRRAEAALVERSMLERTKLSGLRHVPFKTAFPDRLAPLLNPVTLYPLHLVQKVARGRPDALVLYAEFGRPGGGSRS
jgi:SAM-dependent methyltransferase